VPPVLRPVDAAGSRRGPGVPDPDAPVRGRSPDRKAKGGRKEAVRGERARGLGVYALETNPRCTACRRIRRSRHRSSSEGCREALGILGFWGSVAGVVVHYVTFGSRQLEEDGREGRTRMGKYVERFNTAERVLHCSSPRVSTCSCRAGSIRLFHGYFDCSGAGRAILATSTQGRSFSSAPDALLQPREGDFTFDDDDRKCSGAGATCRRIRST